MGERQRLSDSEQLEILGLLEAINTEQSAMRAARALAELMRHVHALGQRIAAELPPETPTYSQSGARAEQQTGNPPGNPVVVTAPVKIRRDG
jgi:hypothetical protein